MGIMKFYQNIVFFMVVLFFSCNAQNNNGFETRLFGTDNDIPKDCIELDNNCLLIIGQHFKDDYESNKNPKVATLIKLNSKGELVWEKSFGYNKDDRFNQIVRKGNTIFIVGTSTDKDYLQRKVWLLKLDLDGNVLNEFKYGNYSEGLKIIVDNDDIYVLGNFLSTEKSRKFYNQAGYLLKIDTKLNLIWDKIVEQEQGFLCFENIYIANDNIYLIGKYAN